MQRRSNAKIFAKRCTGILLHVEIPSPSYRRGFFSGRFLGIAATAGLRYSSTSAMRAEVAELADAPDSGSGVGNHVGVQIPPSAPFLSQYRPWGFEPKAAPSDQRGKAAMDGGVSCRGRRRSEGTDARARAGQIPPSAPFLSQYRPGDLNPRQRRAISEEKPPWMAATAAAAAGGARARMPEREPVKSPLRHHPSLLIATVSPGSRSFGWQAMRSEGCPP